MRVVEASPIPLTDSGLVKMEDRKRPASYENNESAPPLKKQATSVNGGNKSHPDTDMPWKDDLERFQKDAIFRQMQEYKRERNALETRLSDMVKRTKFHDDHLRVIDGWLKQLIDEVRTLIQPSKEHISPPPPSSFPSSLLFADNEWFSMHLQERSKDIEATITALFSNFSQPSPEATSLQAQLLKLLATEKLHIAELEQVRSEKETLEERLEAASLRYLMAEKKLDRAKSVTVAKLEKQAIMSAQKDLTSTTGDGPSSTKKDEGAAFNGTTENGEANADLELEYQRLLATSQKEKKQLENLATENERLTGQITALNIRASRLTDEDYAHTDLFKQLKSQYEDVIKRINNLEALNVKLREEAKKLQAERTKYRTEIEAEAQTAISEKELQLTKAENDLVRIRNARDELHSDLQRHKAVEETDKMFSQRMHELNTAQEERINALESESSRLRLQLEQQDSGTSDLQGLSIEELRSKHQALEQSYAMLNSEVMSMTTALRKTSALATQKVNEIGVSEQKVTRLTAEKAKANEKYFGAMRDKESREVEAHSLRRQNVRSSEIISQYKEAADTSNALAHTLEKQLSDTKDSLSLMLTQHRAALQQAAETNILVEGLKSQIAELKSVLVAKDASFSSASNLQRVAESEAEGLRTIIRGNQKTIEAYKTRGGGNQSAESEMLRLLAMCTVCKLNFKDTVLKTCGHVFCKDCVEERIVSRSRKCPNCGKGFGTNDHMRVTL